MTATVAPTIRSVEAPESAIRRFAELLRTGERRTWTMAETHPVRPELIKYLNRRSDTIYALARLTDRQHDLVRIEQLVRVAVRRALGDGGTRPGPLPEPAEGRVRASADSVSVQSYDLAAPKLMAAAAETKAAELGGERHGIQNFNRGPVVVSGGGLPDFIDGRITGGTGVSGGTVDQDIGIVMHAFSTAQEAR